MATALTTQVKLISQQELLFEKEKGAIVVDIRPIGEYDTGHIKDSVNVSLFRLITGILLFLALSKDWSFYINYI